jgi:hypothetical protein
VRVVTLAYWTVVCAALMTLRNFKHKQEFFTRGTSVDYSILLPYQRRTRNAKGLLDECAWLHPSEYVHSQNSGIWNRVNSTRFLLGALVN